MNPNNVPLSYVNNEEEVFITTPEEDNNDQSNKKKTNILPLAPEQEEGNCEYKLKLVNVTEERIEHLVSQLKWRLGEGMGEAIYELGVEDNGNQLGISQDEMKQTLQNLTLMASKLNADLSVVRKRQGIQGEVAEVLIRKYCTVSSCGDPNGSTEPFMPSETRIAVIGNVDSGKSTLLGVLCSGSLDNGRGNARLNLFKHRHEMETGRTSSITHQLLGFDSSGGSVNDVLYGPSKSGSGSGSGSGSDGSSPGFFHQSSIQANEICQQSSKLINFIDLAGHEKYLKTTLFGLTGHAPDAAMLMIGANMGCIGMTKEHLGIVLALKVPVYVVITKIDMCPEHKLNETLEQIKKILKSPGCRKLPVLVRNEDDVVSCSRNFSSERIAPIFLISNVTGKNLELLKKFLNLLPAQSRWKDFVDDPTVLLTIDSKWHVPGVGAVASGTLLTGSITVGDTLSIGPDYQGAFQSAKVKSIHNKRMSVRSVTCGQTISLALKKIKKSQLRKGMIMTSVPHSPSLLPLCCREFIADVVILFHSTTIQLNYECVVHSNNIQQTAKILEIEKYVPSNEDQKSQKLKKKIANNNNNNSESEKSILRTADKGRVRFRFLYWPEFMQKDSKLIARDGKAKIIGRVVEVCEKNQEIKEATKPFLQIDTQKQQKEEEEDTDIQKGQQETNSKDEIIVENSKRPN